MVINYFLPFCFNECLEKVSANSSVIDFLSVIMELSFERCFIGIACCLPAIFLIISQITLPVLWYLISLLWMHQCSCMHILSMLWSIAEAVSSGSWPFLFKVLTLNVAICIVLLHFSNFCFSLSSEADFSNIGVTAPTSARHAPFLPAWRMMQFGQMVWVWVMGIFWWLCFYSHL